MSAQCNLIFDVDVLADSVDELSARSGIYFTARCILEQLASRPGINVCLYCSPERLYNLSFLRRGCGPRPVICGRQGCCGRAVCGAGAARGLTRRCSRMA